MSEEAPRTGVADAARRLPGLDVLRAIAVLLTLFRHMTPEPPVALWRPARLLMSALQSGGWCGVDLFFVLSGYLVSGLLFAEVDRHGRVEPLRFLARRGLKIYPSFYLLLLGYGAMEVVATGVPSVGQVLSEALFIQNYVPGLWNHTWSLAVEEHFYLSATVGLWALARAKRVDWTPYACIAVCCACTVGRVAAYDLVDGNTLYPSHFRADSLAFGVLVAWVTRYRPSMITRAGKWLGVTTAVGLVAVLPLFTVATERYAHTWGLTVNYLAFGSLVAWVVSKPGASFGPNWVAYAGTYSYTTYLWHMAVKRGLSLLRQRGLFTVPYLAEFVLFVALSFVVGLVTSRLVEGPVLRLRERWFPSRAA